MVAFRSSVCGDPPPLDAMLLCEGPATFFPPFGGLVSGAEAGAARYDGDARLFSPGGETQLDVLQSGGSGSLAFWTGFQDATVEIGGHEVTMRRRITELFRLRGG